MTTAEHRTLARIHAQKLSVLAESLEGACYADATDKAVEMLPHVLHEVHIIAGHVKDLVGKRRDGK